MTFCFSRKIFITTRKSSQSKDFFDILGNTNTDSELVVSAAGFSDSELPGVDAVTKSSGSQTVPSASEVMNYCLSLLLNSVAHIIYSNLEGIITRVVDNT